MLILTRKVHESIMIGTKVRIEIIDIDEHAIRLGIDAPRIIPVHRHEIYERIQRHAYIKQKYLNKRNPYRSNAHESAAPLY